MMNIGHMLAQQICEYEGVTAVYDGEHLVHVRREGADGTVKLYDSGSVWIGPMWIGPEEGYDYRTLIKMGDLSTASLSQIAERIVGVLLEVAA